MVKFDFSNVSLIKKDFKLSLTLSCNDFKFNLSNKTIPNLKMIINGRSETLSIKKLIIELSKLSPSEKKFEKIKITKISIKTVKFAKTTENNILIFLFLTFVSFETKITSSSIFLTFSILKIIHLFYFIS